MIGFNNDLTDLQELDDLTEGLDDFDSQYGRNSMGDGIAEGISQTVKDTVLPLAVRNAKPHVGEHAEKITASGGNWEGRTYEAGLRARDPVVASHEYGSGIHGPKNRAYRIDPGPGKEKLSFESGGEQIAVEYVIHPGVEGKGFLAQAGAESLDVVVDEIGDEVESRLERATR